MEYLVKEECLELKHEHGKGAWTYHIQIPNTKHLIGKWGTLKASGTIDHYAIDNINLFTITGRDKLISVNEKIRKAINKTGGDTVSVTLYLLNPKNEISTQEIKETFKESGVLAAFQKLTNEEQNKIIAEIKAIKSDEKQIQLILKYIHQLSNSNV